MMLKLAISWLPAPRPVPHSKRRLVKWSSIAARSAKRTGCSLRGDRLLMPVDEVDVVGLRGDVAHDDLGRRHVAVLGERVVLAEPGVLPVVLVGEDHVLGLAEQLGVLELGVVGRRARGCSR